ncbi:MAG: serine/threonine protein kinase [Kofleriaceae bacterium]|nr:serine/threonine protein kinase [Kofleriaceae bacterium]
MTPLENNESKSKVDPVLAMTIGNYQVTKKIGEGGMGSVYLAEHPLIGKKVALKVLHPEFSSNQDVVTRFFNEARAVNDIQHPNIVDIIDYGTIPGPNGDMVYFFMEHLDGNPLEDVIEEQSPIDPDRCLHICLQVADALAASHNTNIVHRDLKPDNIILLKKRSTDDFVKLLDFGIAKLTGDQPGSSRTRTGIVMGTPSYMSPEQCEGRGMIDKRTDVYALGIVMYQMLSGRVPFLGEGYGEILVQHLTQLPIPLHKLLDTVPPHVEAVCMKALEKKPDDRYQNMEDFMAALENPVGFVEANGGLEGFYNAQLDSPVIPAQLTPMPPPRGNTEGGSTSAFVSNTAYGDSPATKSRAPIFVGIGVVAAVGIGLAVTMTSESSDSGAKAVSVTTPDTPPTEKEPAAAAIAMDAGSTVDDTKQPSLTPPVTVVAVSAQVFSKPRGAEVWIADDFLGNTPFVISDYKSDELPLTITLKNVGYENVDMAWEFSPDQAKQKYKFKAGKMKKAKRKSGKRRPTGSTTTKPTDTKSTTKPPRNNVSNGTGLLEPGGGGSTRRRTNKKVGNDTMEPGQ